MLSCTVAEARQPGFLSVLVVSARGRVQDVTHPVRSLACWNVDTRKGRSTRDGLLLGPASNLTVVATHGSQPFVVTCSADGEALIWLQVLCVLARLSSCFALMSLVLPVGVSNQALS